MNRIKKAFSVFLAVCMTLMQMLWNGVFVLPAYADTGIQIFLDVFSQDIPAGEEETILIYLPENATGTVTATILSSGDEVINTNTYTLNEEMHGEVVSNWPGLPVGIYTIQVSYSGDNTYEPAEGIGSFMVTSVGGVSCDIDIDIQDITVGNDEMITAALPEDATGMVGLTIDCPGFEPIIHIQNITADDHGVVKWTETDLTTGVYYAEVKYCGDDKYVPAVWNGSFMVSGTGTDSCNIGLTAQNIKIGEEEKITVTMPGDATGNVLLTIVWPDTAESQYLFDAAEGNDGVIDIYEQDLPSGPYEVNVTYCGDEKYGSSYAAGSFTVTATGTADCNINADVYDIDEGDEETITVKLPEDATGAVSLTIEYPDENQEYFGTLITEGDQGQWTLGFPWLPAGTYSVYAVYYGDEQYKAGDWTGSFTVKDTQDSWFLDVFSQDISAGEEETILIYLPENATGTVTATILSSGDEVINTNTYTLNEEMHGEVVSNWPGLPVGIYTIQVSYSGDDTYEPASGTDGFMVTSVGEASCDINVDVQDITVDNDETITAALPEDATGMVGLTIYCPNSEPIKHIHNITADDLGVMVWTETDLTPGVYYAEVKYCGDDKYGPVWWNGSFMVSGTGTASCDIQLTAQDINIGEEEKITVTMPGDATGNVLLTIVWPDTAERQYLLDAAEGNDGVIEINEQDLPAGPYEVNVTYCGDEKYGSSYAAGSFTVTATGTADCNISMDVYDIDEGDEETITVKLPEDATGAVSLTIEYPDESQENFGNLITEGDQGQWTLGFPWLPAGTYSVYAVYYGDEQYKAGDWTGSFTVRTSSPPEVTNATVRIVWDDENDQDGKRPESLTFTLADSGGILDPDDIHITVNADSEWKATVENLPKYYNGQEIEYIWNEEANSLPEGYTLFNTETEDRVTTRTYKHTPETVDIKAIKSWDDAGNEDKRPDSVTIRLMADGAEVMFQAVTDTTGWEYTFENLPKYSDGQEIEYTVAEDVPNGYNSETTGDANDGFTITNIYAPAPVEYTVNVILDENMSLASGKNPQTVTEGNPMTEVVITANTGYYFPENYAVNIAAVNGIGVTWENAGQIKVSGIPTSEVNLSLPDASAKITPGAPSVEKTDCTTRDNNNGKITGVNSTMEYQNDGDTDWTPIGDSVTEISGLTPGVYHVRYKETDTANASEQAVVEIQGFTGPAITIKARNQTYTYNGQPQGESGQTYDDPDVINEKVTVDGLLEGDKLAEIGLSGQRTEVGQDPIDITSFTITDTNGVDVTNIYSNVITENGILTIEQAALTITANYQEYVYNGELQGEDGTPYDDPAQIAEKVTVSELQGQDYLHSIVLNGQGKEAGEYEIVPSGAVICRNGEDVTGNYEITYANGILKITGTPEMAVRADDIYFDEHGMITVAFSSDVTGEVDFKLTNTTSGGEYYYENCSFDNRNEIEFEVPDLLPVGIWNILAELYNDNNELVTIAETTFTVKTKDSSVTLSVQNITVGEDEVIGVTIPSDATGTVTVTVTDQDGNSNTYDVTTSEGTGKKILQGLAAGTYNVEADYPGDDKYDASDDTATFTVTKEAFAVTVTVQDITVGEDEVIGVTIPSDATGTVTVTVTDPDGNSVDYDITTSGGTGQKTLQGLAAGTYSVTAEYSGDDKYETSDDTATFIVTDGGSSPLLPSTTTVTVQDITVGEDEVIGVTIPSDATGTVTVTVTDPDGNSVDYDITTSGGTGQVTLQGLAAGMYSVTAEYPGDDKYEASTSDTATFTVAKAAFTVTLRVQDIIVGEDEEIVVKIPSDATGTVTVTVTDQDGNSNNYDITTSEGTGQLTLPGLAAGTYSVTAEYPGDDKYEPSTSIASTFTVTAAATVTYTVSFDSGEGSGTMDIVPDVSGNYKLPECLFKAPDGKTFDCWLVDGKEYAPGNTINVTGNTVVTAQWKDIPAHVHKLSKVDAKDATCTENGNETYYQCSGCDLWFWDGTGTHKIDDKKEAVIPAKGHKWDGGTVKKEATETEDGIRTYTCQNGCGATRTEIIPATGSGSDDSGESGGSSSGGPSSGGSSSGGSSSGGSSSGGSSSGGSSSGGSSSGGSSSGGSGGGGGSSSGGGSSGGPKGTSGSSGGPGAGSVLGASRSGDSNGSWTQDDAGWHYLENGTPVVNDWRCISYNGKDGWYFFNGEGVMQTGWIEWKDNLYYLNPESDGWKGMMLIGWQLIGGKWYYFEPAPGSNQGRMYRSEWNNEGYYLGADGAWVENPEKTGN